MYTVRKLRGRSRRWVGGAAAGLLILTLSAACGPDHTIEVVSPGPGDVVTVPFQVTVEASVPLGLASEGLHHMHIWFDDQVDAYLAIEGPEAEITNAPDGEHQMHVSLHNADHSPAGAETSLPLVIRGGTTTVPD